jgi:hypothetical protein
MAQPFVAVGIDVVLGSERTLVEVELGALIDDGALVAAKRHAVLLALEEVLPHLGPNLLENEAQMRRDRVVAQHRMSPTHKVRTMNREVKGRASTRMQTSDPAVADVTQSHSPKARHAPHPLISSAPCLFHGVRLRLRAPDATALCRKALGDNACSGPINAHNGGKQGCVISINQESCAGEKTSCRKASKRALALAAGTFWA